MDTYNNLLELKRNGVNIVATNNSWKTTILSKTAAEAMEALGEAGVVNVMAAGNDHSDNDVTMGFPYNIRSKHSIVVAGLDAVGRDSRVLELRQTLRPHSRARRVDTEHIQQIRRAAARGGREAHKLVRKRADGRR